jgi:DNA-nicking Smr family endonuclease
MKKKPTVAQQDLDTFREAVKGTKRMKHDKIDLTGSRLSPGRRSPTSPTTDRADRSSVGWAERSSRSPTSSSLELNETSDLPKVGGETPLSYNQPGISHKILRNLRKGQYNVEAVLDLHGMTISEAKIAVSKFLQQCMRDSMRVVLIIHGKGRGEQPILKNKVNQWLRGIREVLAFCTASTMHGSRGAIYILLKRTHEKER